MDEPGVIDLSDVRAEMIDRDEIEIEIEIGAGAFAVVSRGWCRGTRVAVKQPKTSIFHGFTKDQLKAFRDEVRVLSHIRHPNLVLFLGMCVTQDSLFIVTELLDGGNLMDILETPAQISLYQRMKWAMQAFSGLSWLHGSGCLHLDVKPANLLIEKNTLKLADFGLSKLLPVGKHFKSSRARGTPIYTSPEVLSGDTFDHKTDIYSMGVSLAVIVSRKRPQLPEEAYTSKDGFIRCICPPSNMRPALQTGFPPSLKTLVQWCWDPQASLRPTAAVCVEKLEALIIESAVVADEVGAAVWGAVSDEKGVKESVSFEILFQALCSTLGLRKKSIDSQSAVLLKALLGSMSGNDAEVTLVDYGRLVGLLGPMDKEFLKRMKRLMRNLWFFGGTSTSAAEKALLATQDGSFLIRFSSQPSNFTLSYVKGGKIWHTRIIHKASVERFELDGSGQILGTLELLVAAAVRSKYENISKPCSNNPFEMLFKRKKNSIGGYT